VASVALSAGALGQPAGQSEVKAVVRDNTQFAVDLYGQLAKQPGNLFFSPYSISSALAMTYGGARGKTAQEMAATLRFERPAQQVHEAFAALNQELRGSGAKRAYELTVANALWGQKGYVFHPEFLQLTQKYYGAGLQALDFMTATEKAREEINGWVAKQTHDKIKDLIPQGALVPDTRLLLTNAIYFKAAWENEFPESATKPAPFTAGAKKLDVDTMHRTFRTQYLAADAFQMLVLPYERNQLSLIVFLPKDVDGLGAVEGQFSADRLQDWLTKAKKYEVDTFLPKFKVTAQFKLKPMLTAMGMGRAFSDAADFSGIRTAEALKIDDVLHKAFIDLHEKGTEAAAATAVTIRPLSAPLPEQLERVTFRADHPFAYLIRENRTGSVLFMGRLENPK
jgi:serpin B